MTSNRERTLLLQLHQLEQAGRFKAAGDAYQQLLSQNPGHPFLLWGLGRCLMHFGRRNGAADLFQRAVAAYPAHVELTEDVIQRLNLVGHPQAALRLSDQARKRFPGRVALELHRVDALRLLNRQAEALPALRKIMKAPHPPGGAVLRLIACLRQTGQLQEALALADKVLGDFDGDVLDRAGILNEMAHAQEGMGDYRAAFDSFSLSGAIARQSPQAQSVDATSYPQLLQSLEASINSQGLSDPPDHPKANGPLLVFQVGFPRSGTTLVESLLAAHPRVQTSGESPLWNTALGMLLEAGLSADTMLEELPHQPVAVLERARQAYWHKVRAEFGEDFDLFVDKQPMNILYLAHIRLLFPDARILFCERDPRDVCLSCFFQWFQINASSIHFLDWRDTATFYRQVMDFWLTLRPLVAEVTYPLRYERFIADIECEAKNLFDFLKLEWDESLLAFQEKNRERYFHTPSNQAIHRDVEVGASPRWRHYSDAIAEVEPILGPVVKKLGYQSAKL